MADSDLAGAHIAGQTSESQAAADIPAQVDDQAPALLLFEIVNRAIQCVRKSHPHGAGKVGDLEKSNVLPNFRVNRALRFDDWRALFRSFPHGNFNHDLFRARLADFRDKQRVSVADRKVWCGRGQTSRAVHRVQDISRPDSGNDERVRLQTHPETSICAGRLATHPVSLH